MTYAYFFSIVVPTRNRVDTLKYTLETCLNQISFDDYEIVVNDNSDDDTTGSYIIALMEYDVRAQRKIKYFRRSTVGSMSENFDDGIGRASGSFVIVIGDDDGVLPKALCEIHDLIERNNVDIVKWKNGLYNWPKMSVPGSANYLGFSLSRSTQLKSCADELDKSLDLFNYENLPMLYINSAISRKVIDLIKGKDGTIFKSQSPDIYSALVIAYRCENFLETTIPFTLAGLSHHSNGVSFSFNGANSEPKSDFTTLNAQAGIYRHPTVPNVNVFPHVAFAETFYHAKLHHFESDVRIQLSRRRLMEACVARADTSVEAICEELMRVCEDDRDLGDFTRDLIAAKSETLSAPRLKPALLGFDGDNLHLDPQDYGVTTIADAVALVHRIIWPANASLRYDLPGANETRSNLEVTLQDLQKTRHDLVERSGDLEAAFAELHDLRVTLAERSANLEATLMDIRSVRETLIDRTTRLEAALDECQHLRGRLTASDC